METKATPRFRDPCEKIAWGFVQSAQIAGLVVPTLANPAPEPVVLRLPWRANVKVFCSTNGNTSADRALVRIYAVTRGVRAEVGRGRMPSVVGQAPEASVKIGYQALCADLRTPMACDEYEVTVAYDGQGALPLAAGQPPITIVGESFGFEGAAPTRPIVTTMVVTPASGDWVNGGIISGVPVDLYEIVIENPTVNDVWVFLKDPQQGGTHSTIAPIYVPAQGTVSFFAGEVPFRFSGGLNFVVSSSPVAIVALPTNTLNFHATYG